MAGSRWLPLLATSRASAATYWWSGDASVSTVFFMSVRTRSISRSIASSVELRCAS